MLVLVDSPERVREVQRHLTALGLWSRPESGREAALVIEPHSSAVDPLRLRDVPGVRDVLVGTASHPRIDAQAGSKVTLAGVVLDAAEPLLIAGPCAVESREQIAAAAQMAQAAGARLLRGGAFKPRTSPYSFQGHGRAALGWLRDAAHTCGLGVITEVMSEADAPAVAEAADVIQLGSRSMQSFALLAAVGRAAGAAQKPVLLKRGAAARIDEWLLAGEHLLVAGAPAVVFCERGIVGFDPSTRNLLDLGAVALLARLGQPVLADPSHAAGRRDLVAPLAAAAVAAGAQGVIVEAHPDAASACSDGPQALSAAELLEVGRRIGVRR